MGRRAAAVVAVLVAALFLHVVPPHHGGGAGTPVPAGERASGPEAGGELTVVVLAPSGNPDSAADPGAPTARGDHVGVASADHAHVAGTVTVDPVPSAVTQPRGVSGRRPAVPTQASVRHAARPVALPFAATRPRGIGGGRPSAAEPASPRAASQIFRC